jgi:hypothetical protein
MFISSWKCKKKVPLSAEKDKKMQKNGTFVKFFCIFFLAIHRITYLCTKYLKLIAL